MPDVFSSVLKSFRPTDASLSARSKARIQVYRLLSLLGALLFPAVGVLYKTFSFAAVDPLWARFVITGLLVGLFGVSYLSATIRRRYVGLAWGLLVLTMAWVMVLTVLNQFAGEYAMAFLFIYALFGGIVALGSESMEPVLWFFGAGFVLVGAGAWSASTYQTSPLILTTIMGLVVLFEGVCTGWVLSMRDRLAGQKQELRRQKSLLEQAQRLTGAWMVDLRTDEVSWSEEGYRIHGLDPNTELSLEEAFEFPTSEAVPKLREAFGRCVDEGVPYDLEHPIVTAEGTRRWVHTVGAPVEEENGEVVKVAGAFQDITPQKEVLQVLREEQEVLRRMYHITADRDAAFDAKVERLMDLGRSYLDLSYGYVTRVSGDTQVITHAAGDHPSIRSGEHVPLSNTYCRRTVEEGVLAVHDASAAGWAEDPAPDTLGVEAYIGSTVEVGGDLYGTFCFAADTPREDSFSDREETFVELLTLWASYELDRRRATRQLEEQNQRLDRFASVVSHDLRTPLNVAQGRLQLARDAVDPETITPAAEAADESPDAIDHLDAAGRALERMTELIEDMLVLTWGDRSADRDDVAPVPLRTVAEECWPDVEEAASLTVETDGTIVAHEGRLRQLLENLFRNALDHGGENVAVRVGLLPANDADGAAAGFFVEDDGPGIPEAKREKVLETGYTTSEEGTGLGLSIAQSVADSHDWSLSIAEGRDGGARFELRGVEVQR